MIKNIIFDWSGVINDDLFTAYKAIMLLFKRFAVKEISLEEFRREWEQPHMLFYNKYIPKLTIDEEIVAYRSAYKSVLSKYPPKPYSHIKDTLKKFKKAGINMIVISANLKETLLFDIDEFGLHGLFNEINNDVHDKAEIIKETIQRNKFNPRETIFICDTTHEVNAGKSVDIITGAVTWGYQKEDKLKSSNPDFIIYDLKALESIIFNK